MTTPTLSSDTLGGEMLYGAAAIAMFVFGDPALRRRVYHYRRTSNNFPIFKVGSTICGRRSTLRKWIEDQERGSCASRNP